MPAFPQSNCYHDWSKAPSKFKHSFPSRFSYNVLFLIDLLPGDPVASVPKFVEFLRCLQAGSWRHQIFWRLERWVKFQTHRYQTRALLWVITLVILWNGFENFIYCHDEGKKGWRREKFLRLKNCSAINFGIFINNFLHRGKRWNVLQLHYVHKLFIKTQVISSVLLSTSSHFWDLEFSIFFLLICL